MEAVFLKIVNMSLTAGWMVLAVMALRALFPGWPKRIRVILWALVGIRLVLPFSFQTSLSLIPSSEPLPQEFLYAAAPKIATGIPVLNDAINPVLAGSLTPHPGASANPTQIWSFIFSQIWILGMVVMVLYAAFSFLAVRRRVSVSIPRRDALRPHRHPLHPRHFPAPDLPALGPGPQNRGYGSGP